MIRIAASDQPTRDPEGAAGRPAAHALDISLAEDGDSWDRFVEEHPSATAYHRWEWRTVFESVFGQRCEYLIAMRGRTVAGVLPLVSFRSRLFGRFHISLPYVNYGGVLADAPDTAHALIEAAAERSRCAGSSYLELRHAARLAPGLPARQHKVAMQLPLCADPDRMWQQVDRKVRNQVRKAEKSQLAGVTGGTELVGEFYDVFARNMRDLGTPVYARRLFEVVMRLLGDRARIHVVRAGDVPVAAALAIAHRDGVEVPWASARKDALALCPNMLLYWHAIRHAIESGARTFDFGRSTPGEGTYQFKKQWGAVATPLAWEYWLPQDAAVPDHGPTNPKFRLAIASWKRLPLWLANSVGPHIVRGIP